MKHKVTVVACLLALAGTGTAAISTALQHQATLTAVHNKAVVSSRAAARNSAQQKAEFTTQLKQLEATCAEQKADYALLSESEKLRTPAPDCSTNVVAP